MKIILLLSMFFPLFISAQFCEIDKENLSKKVNFYYDKNRIKLESSGYYYTDELGETTMKHGRWRYFDRAGILEEERYYVKDMLCGPAVVFYPNKRKQSEGHFVYNKQDSTYTEWWENGKVKVQGEYNLDLPVGKWTYYYLDGRLKSVEEVVDSTTFVYEFYLPDSAHTQTIFEGDGELIVSYQTGSLKEYYEYKDGLKHGKFEEYSIYGYPTLTGEFDQGKKSGEWMYAYYTGDKEKIVHFKDDKLHGAYENFYDNGKTKVEGEYNMGLKTGVWTWYTNEGKVDMTGAFLEDQQHGDWTYYFPEGGVSYKAQFKEGLKDGEWKYNYKNGKRYRIGNYQSDKKEGLWETWYENEVLLMSGSYKEGKEEGKWENYWENGELKNVSTFTAGKLNGEWKSYHQSGRLSLKGEYTDDYKTGEWIAYFENGMPKDVKHYKLFKEKSKINYGIMKNHERVDSKLDGKFIAYSDKDFKVIEEGSYKKGEKHGEWLAYHPGGKLVAVRSQYKEGQLHGNLEQYDKRGRIISSVEYKNGLRDGFFRSYDKRGKVVAEKEFKKGIQVLEGGSNGTGFSPGR